MALTSRDIVPLSHARAHFSELAEEVRAGAEKLITRNGESYVALVDAAKLDRYHRLEAEASRVELLEQALLGLGDVEAGRTTPARTVVRRLRARRAAKKR